MRWWGSALARLHNQPISSFVMSIEFDEELAAVCAVAVGMGAASILEEWQAAHAHVWRQSTQNRVSWWQSTAHKMSAYDVHLRWGIWPSAIQRILELARVPDCPPRHIDSWSELVKIKSVKLICHTLEYLVHGM